MKQQNFFSTLRRRLLKTLDRHSDQIFWNKFESEFTDEFAPQNHVVPVQVSLFARLRFLIPALGVFLIVSGFLFHNRVEYYHATEVMEHHSILKDMDLLKSIDSADMTDDDWDVLLSQSDDEEEAI